MNALLYSDWAYILNTAVCIAWSSVDLLTPTLMLLNSWELYNIHALIDLLTINQETQILF